MNSLSTASRPIGTTIPRYSENLVEQQLLPQIESHSHPQSRLQSQSPSPFDSLPDELLQHIFRLGSRSVARTSAGICDRWRGVARVDSALWKEWTRRRFPGGDAQGEPQDWFKL